jgi:hypothetical protein
LITFTGTLGIKAGRSGSLECVGASGRRAGAEGIILAWSS